MKQQRLRSGLLACLLAASMVAMTACGNSGTESTESPSGKADSTAASTPAESGTDADGRELVGNVYKEGLPIVKETVTYRTIASTSTYLKTPVADLEMWGILEERTGIHLELEEISGTNYSEKVNLLISSNDLPDIFIKSIDEVTDKYYDTGLFLPLEDLIAEWAPNYNELLSDPMTYANVSAMDGHIYATPSGELAPWLDIMDQLFINTVWLDNLGLEMPTNLDEYYEVLKAFKTGDPNGNGLADELPLILRLKDGSGNLITFMSNFGLPIGTGYAMIENDQYVFGPYEDAFRECLEYMHKLYAEGLLDPESLTQGTAEVQAKASGEYQLMGSFINFWADDYCSGEGTLEYFSVPPFATENSDPIWYRSPNVPERTGLSISTKCESPEAILRWADYIISDPLISYDVNYGPESLGLYYIDDEGKIMMNSDKAPGGMTFEEWTRTVTIRDMIPIIFTQDATINYRAIDASPQRKMDYLESYLPYINPVTITNGHTKYYESDDTKQEALTIWTDVQTLVDNYVAESLINGVTDASWQGFHDTLKSANMDRLIEIRQASLDTYNSMAE